MNCHLIFQLKCHYHTYHLTCHRICDRNCRWTGGMQTCTCAWHRSAIFHRSGCRCGRFIFVKQSCVRVDKTQGASPRVLSIEIQRCIAERYLRLVLIWVTMSGGGTLMIKTGPISLNKFDILICSKKSPDKLSLAIAFGKVTVWHNKIKLT